MTSPELVTLGVTAGAVSSPVIGSSGDELSLMLGKSYSFGDPSKGEYLQFDATSKILAIKPGNIDGLSGSGGHFPDLYASIFHVMLTDAGKEVSLQIIFTLIAQSQEYLQSARYLSDKNTKIMKDESTADLKITCGEKEKKKIFNVHKNIFCESSPVFRAAVLEGKTWEIHIEEVDEMTIQEMISYVYTGKFTGADLNAEMVARLADKYNIPGMMDLLCCRMKIQKEFGAENLANMIIAAGKQAKHLQHFFS